MTENLAGRGEGLAGLVAALNGVINERDTELDMMHCGYSSGVGREAWHDGVREAWTRFALVKERARQAMVAALEAAAPAGTAPTAEYLARLFHATYERLAPRYGYVTRKESAVEWEQVPENNRKLMTAVCAAILLTEKFNSEAAALATPSPQAPQEQCNAFSTTSARGSVGVYVASRASIPARSEMWRSLRSRGFAITSTWIDEAGEGETGDFRELWERIWREISMSSHLVLYAEPGDFPLKGALVEVGIALGMGKRVAVVAPSVKLEGRTCRPIGSWIKHPNVRFYESPEAALIVPAATQEPAGSGALREALAELDSISDLLHKHAVGLRYTNALRGISIGDLASRLDRTQVKLEAALSLSSPIEPARERELESLIVHMWIHSGYTKNGYQQMTTPQKALYDGLVGRSEEIAERDMPQTAVMRERAQASSEIREAETPRQFVYRFLEMPHHTQFALAKQYGVFSESDGDMPDSDLFVIWFRRLRERGMLEEFRAEVAALAPSRQEAAKRVEG